MGKTSALAAATLSSHLSFCTPGWSSGHSSPTSLLGDSRSRSTLSLGKKEIPLWESWHLFLTNLYQERGAVISYFYCQPYFFWVQKIITRHTTKKLDWKIDQAYWVNAMSVILLLKFVDLTRLGSSDRLVTIPGRTDYYNNMYWFRLIKWTNARRCS